MSGRLAGKRVLIVEDEYFIASDLKRALQKEDAVVVGPVGDLDGGLALAGAEDGLDAAVLDVNLEGSQTYPLADRLAENDVPHLFVTGYDAWSMPPRYRDTPRMAKPFTVAKLVDRVVDLVSGARA